MKIYIGFSSPKTFKIGACLIKCWTRSQFSHVYLRVEDTVYHAALGSVHKLDFNSGFKDKNKVICEIEILLDPVITEALLERAEELLGQPYGYLELFKIVVYDIANTFGCKIAFSDSRGYICSELVGQFLAGYYGVEFSKPYHLLTPKDIYLGLKSHGKT